MRIKLLFFICILSIIFAASCGMESEDAEPICGNGTVEATETCDDGNTVNNDGCSDVCAIEACGDGIMQLSETCDDGNLVNDDGCDSNCILESCGNGIIQGIETCDDGNLTNTDACLDTCTIASCGDGFIHIGVEQCDDGNIVTETCAYGELNCTVCNATCQTIAGTTSVCGDGVIDAVAGETCDDGNIVTEACAYGEINCSVCNASCQTIAGTTSVCGDGVIDAVAGETCDDGNIVTETCAYGELNCSVCNASCQTIAGTISVCGDGVIDAVAGETCDDGNLLNNDHCSSTCQTEFCGDGITQTNESCDDANQNNLDGCMNNCQVDEDMDGYSTLSDINDTNASLHHMSINLEGLHTENFGVLFWQVSDISDGDNLTGGGDTIGHAIPEPYDEPNEMRALAQFRCGCANPTVDAHAFYFFAPYHFENIPNLIDETYANSIPGLNVPNYVYDPNTPSGYAKGVSTDGFDHLITTLQHQGKSIANVIIDASGPYTLGLDRENTEWTFDLNTGVEVRHYEPSLGTQVSIKIDHTTIIHLGSPIVTLTLHHNAANTLADDTASMVYNIPNAALSIADGLNDDMNNLAHAFIDAVAGRDLRITISTPTPLISAFELDNNVDLEYLRNTTDQSKRVVEVYNLPNFKIETINSNN